MEAMYNLAMCYLNGSGVQKDYSQAVSWLTKAVKKKYPAAQYQLAVCYMYGTGVLKDLRRAWELNEKAVYQGFPDALYLKSYCFKNGICVVQNNAQAYAWLDNAAKMGSSDALADFACAYLYGDDTYNIKKDASKAFAYASRAADLGHVRGLCYK